MEEDYIIKEKLHSYPLWKYGRPRLILLDLELTERCNNNCRHCYINLPAEDANAKKKELSTQQLKKIIQEAASLGCIRVRFTGGEALLRNDFEELYLFTRKLGLKVLIFTNATLITERLAKLFSRIPPLDNIEVSIYGMKKASYESVTRAKGSFEAAREGIKLLLEKKVPFIVKGSMLPYAKEELDKFEAWAQGLPWMKKKPTYVIYLDLRCRRDNEKKNRRIKKLRLSPAEGFRMSLRSNSVDFHPLNRKEWRIKYLGPHGDRLFLCSAGLDHACVDAYGYLFPCLMLKHPQTGYDLKRGSLGEGLTGFFAGVRKKRAVASEYLKRCARCFLKGICSQCPAQSWLEHGVLDMPVEYCCRVAHNQAVKFGLLKETEAAWDIDDWKDRVMQVSKKIGMRYCQTMP
jgi:radical SAM protein with 4Fe4S-binding SPASM domain